MSSPLPLQGRLGHQTVVFDYFFNNDLEFLKTSDPEKTYTTSIMKTKVAWYEIVGIEDMSPTLWSTIKHGTVRVELHHRIIDFRLGYNDEMSRRKWKLGHEHKFITKIVARRANECIVSITEPGCKNINKNDIEDMYLLIMNGKKVNLTAPAISFPGVEKHKMFSIIYELVHGIIYKNNKKEKRVMRHSEIHKFCDATLNRVLEGLRSYNIDVKYGYIQRDLTNKEVEYLKLFEEEIKVILKYQN
ncbi:hypothetical protein Tco_0266091 [Tanacetum coccineum]